MQALKGLVIFMGLAILAIVGFIIYTIAGRSGGLVETANVGASTGGSFGEVEVSIPAGCRLAGSETGAGRLLLRLEGPLDQGCQQILILDLESGKQLGRVTARSTP